MKENAGANGFLEESQTTYHVDACTPARGNNRINCCEDERLTGSVAARKHKVARDVVPIAIIYENFNKVQYLVPLQLSKWHDLELIYSL